MRTLSTELIGYNRRVDSSVSIRVNTLIELSSNDIAEIDSHRNNVCFLILTDSLVGNEVNLNIDDILQNLPENDTITNYKTPSKRFRDVLWRLLEQDLKRQPTKEEFTDYYIKIYNKVIEHYKSKFEDNLIEEKDEE